MSRVARFTASRISELLAGGKTAQSYSLDLALNSLGIKEDISTAAMKHGINNQINAFEKVVKPIHNIAIWYDEYLPINNYCGASPDILIDGSPMDIKCPYFVDTYFEQINSIPKKYYAQVQMQMMACGSETGYLCYYLTAPEIWGSEEWEEYPLDILLRYKIFDLKQNEEMQHDILTKVEEYEPQKQYIISLLNDAMIVDSEQYFYMQLDGFKLRKLKECSNILNLEKVIRVGDSFYYEKK